jgi:E-phenylitaconyl-CoA hydratase
MAYQPVLLEIEEGVALVTLNRPEAGNASDAEMAHELIDLWPKLHADEAVRAVVLTGAGNRHFCTGADMKLASQEGDTGFDAWGDVPEDFFKPVICAVNGVVAGGGWHFMWQADFAIASDNATFLEPHVSVGWVPLREMLGMALRVPQGPIRRMAYMGTAERMDAQRAYELGIVTEIVASDELVPRALEIARIIARQAPLAVQTTKETFQRAFDLRYAWRPLYDHMHEKRIQVDWHSEDGKEGPRAFAEKRKAEWKGR